MKKIMLEDEHGVVNIYLLPFIKPAMVRPYFEEQIDSYDGSRQGRSYQRRILIQTKEMYWLPISLW